MISFHVCNDQTALKRNKESGQKLLQRPFHIWQHLCWTWQFLLFPETKPHRAFSSRSNPYANMIYLVNKISPFKSLIGVFSKSHSQSIDSMVQSKPPLHCLILSKAENWAVWSVMTQQGWHIALQERCSRSETFLMLLSTLSCQRADSNSIQDPKTHNSNAALMTFIVLLA